MKCEKEKGKELVECGERSASSSDQDSYGKTMGQLKMEIWKLIEIRVTCKTGFIAPVYLTLSSIMFLY